MNYLHKWLFYVTGRSIIIFYYSDVAAAEEIVLAVDRRGVVVAPEGRAHRRVEQATVSVDKAPLQHGRGSEGHQHQQGDRFCHFTRLVTVVECHSMPHCIRLLFK